MIVTHTWTLASPLHLPLPKCVEEFPFPDDHRFRFLRVNTPFSLLPLLRAPLWNRSASCDSPVLRNRDASAPPDQVARWYINNPAFRGPVCFRSCSARTKEKRERGTARTRRLDRWETEARVAACLAGASLYIYIYIRIPCKYLDECVSRRLSFRLWSSASPRDAAQPRGLLTDFTAGAVRSSRRRDDYHVVYSRARDRGIVLHASKGGEGGKRFCFFSLVDDVLRLRFPRTRVRGCPDPAGPTWGALGTRPEPPPLPSSRLTITRRPYRRRRRCCRQTDGEGGGGGYAVESAVRTYYRLTPPRQRRNELARHEGSKAPRQNNNRTQPPTPLSPTTARELGGRCRCRRCRCRRRRCPVAVTRARRPSSLYFLSSTTARDQP